MSDVCGDNRFEIIDAYKKRLIEDTNIESQPDEMAVIDNILFRFWQMGWLPDAHPEQQKSRIFQGIIVEYLSISTYTEYEGKPYFSIKYTEDGQDFIGYGTYKPDVLSEYLKEYFMPSAEPSSARQWYQKGYRDGKKAQQDMKRSFVEYVPFITTWLMDYQVRAAKLKGRYTAYEVLGWVVNDWMKENPERPDEP